MDWFKLGSMIFLAWVAWKILEHCIGYIIAPIRKGRPDWPRAVVANCFAVVGGGIVIASLILGPMAWIYFVDFMGWDIRAAVDAMNEAQDRTPPEVSFGHIIGVGVGWLIGFGIIGIGNKIDPPGSWVDPKKGAPPQSLETGVSTERR